ncbi:EpsG family protein [Empedobacter falsenii]
MIPIEYYALVYHISLAITVIMLSLFLFKKNLGDFYSSENNRYAMIVLTLIILFIGLRDPWGSWMYLGDTGAYTRTFENITIDKLLESKDYGFDLFMYLSAQVMSIQWFYLLCALIYVGLPYLAFRKWFGNRAWLALLVYVTAMSFWAFGINGLRNGLAAAFFIYGISFIRQPLKLTIWLVIAIGFHKSMLLPVAAFVLTRFIKNTTLLIRVWLLAIPVAFLFGKGLETTISSFFDIIGLSDKRTENLFVEELDGQAVSRSFRLDFIIYSGVAVFLGYYYIINKKYIDVLYIRIFNTYLIANTVWILMIYAAFTNRTAYLSWFMMPLVLIYPLLKVQFVKKQSHWVFWIIIGSLLFTLLMFLK